MVVFAYDEYFIHQLADLHLSLHADFLYSVLSLLQDVESLIDAPVTALADHLLNFEQLTESTILKYPRSDCLISPFLIEFIETDELSLRNWRWKIHIIIFVGGYL